MSFLETVEKSFLGFNDTSKHKHVVKNLCFESLVLKVQILCNYIDRQYMNSSHMKPLQLILINVTEKSHEKLCKTTTVEDYVVRSISAYTSIMENV